MIAFSVSWKGHGGVCVLSLCFLEFSVDVRAFVIGPSQIFSLGVKTSQVKTINQVHGLYFEHNQNIIFIHHVSVIPHISKYVNFLANETS